MNAGEIAPGHMASHHLCIKSAYLFSIGIGVGIV
jgi:hypothetical protein